MDIEKIVECDNFKQFQSRIFSLTLQNELVCVLPALDGSVIIVQEYYKPQQHKNQRQIINHIGKRGKKLGSISFKYSSGQYCIINNTKIVRLGIPYHKISEYNEIIESERSKESKYFQISLTDWNLLTHDQDNFTLKEPVQECNLRSIVLFSFPLTQIVSYMLQYYEPEKDKLQFRFKTYKVPISSDKGYNYKPLVYIFPKNKIKFSSNHEFRCVKLNDQQKLAIFPFYLNFDAKQFEFVCIDLIKGEIKQYKFQFPQDFPSKFDKEKTKMKNKSYLTRVTFQSDICEMFSQVFYLRFQTTQSKIQTRRSWTYFWDSKTGQIVSPNDQPRHVCYYAVFSNSLRLNQYFYDKAQIYSINLHTMRINHLDMPEKKAQKYVTYRNKKVYTDYHPRVLIANSKKKWILRTSVYEFLQLPFSHAQYIAFMMEQIIHQCDMLLVSDVIKLSELNQYKTVFEKNHDIQQ